MSNKMYDFEAKPGFEKDRLEKLYFAAKHQKYTDVEFTVRDRSIFAHMVILAACSEIFINESVDKLNAIFARFDDEIIDAIIKYCYTGIINIDKDQYEKLKELATQLQITNLYYKTIDLKNCLEALTFSNDPDSIEIAMDLALENYEILYKTPDFLRLPSSTLIELIKRDFLIVSSEMHVLNSIKLWVDKNDKKRRPNLKELLSFVKLPALIMEINFTEVQFGFYSSEEYMKMVEEAIKSTYQKSTTERWTRTKIAVIGPHDNNGYNSIEIFNSKENDWTLSKDYDFQREHYVSVLVDNWLMIIGGRHSSKVDYIDLKDGQKYPLKDLNQERWFFSAVAILRHSSTDAYVIGGTTTDEVFTSLNPDDDKNEDLLSSVERWNTKTKNWDYVAPLRRAVSSCSATVIDDRIYVTGGQMGANGVYKACSKVQMYSENTWSFCARMIQDRLNHSSVAIKGKLYVAGGIDIQHKSSNLLDSVESFDPRANLWTHFCRLPSPRFGISLCNFRNRLLCIGGGAEDGQNTITLNDVLEYDDRKKNWKTLKSLHVPRGGSPLCVAVIPYNSII